MNGENNFNNNQFNGGFNNQMPQQNNQGGNFNNSNGMQGFNQQDNGFNNQVSQSPMPNSMPQNNFNQAPGQFQNGPMPMPMNNQFNNGQQKNNGTIKIVGIVVGVVAVIGIAYTFLGGKSLTCTKHDSIYGMAADDTIKLKFKNDKIVRVDQTFVLDMGSYASQKDTMIESIKEEYDEDISGFSISTDTNGNKVTFNISATSEEAIDEYFIAYGEPDYDSTKSTLEKRGYSCK